MSKHPIALLGAGIFAREAHLPAILKADRLDLKTVYSRSTSSAKELAGDAKVPFYSGDQGQGSSGSLDDLLARDDIKTVVVCMPINVQPDIILSAFRAGKNVISEKPVGKDIASAKKLIETFENEFRPKGLQWMIAEQFPYEPGFVKMRELFDSELGELRSFKFESAIFIGKDNKYYNTPWRKEPGHVGGFLLDGGVHQCAGLRYILGPRHRLASVLANSALQHEHLAPQDTLVGLLTTEDGKHGSFELNVACETGINMSFTIRGSRASMYAKFEHTQDQSKAGRGGMVWTIRVARGMRDPEEVESLPSWGVEDEFKAFAEALIAGPMSAPAKDVDERSGPRATLKDVELIQGAIESSSTGKPFKLL